MKVFNWSQIISAFSSSSTDFFFANGCGISVGSFDGIHKGHRALINSLMQKSRELSVPAGVLTFTHPLSGVKNTADYKGDIYTLDQRLKVLQELGLDFIIIVDFNEDFAALSGPEFLNILIKSCNMKLLAEGSDFKCGYKGSMDAAAIKEFCQGRGVETVFIDTVFFQNGEKKERISSSCIRNMINSGNVNEAEELLDAKLES